MVRNIFLHQKSITDSCFFFAVVCALRTLPPTIRTSFGFSCRFFLFTLYFSGVHSFKCSSQRWRLLINVYERAEYWPTNVHSLHSVCWVTSKWAYLRQPQPCKMQGCIPWWRQQQQQPASQQHPWQHWALTLAKWQKTIIVESVFTCVKWFRILLALTCAFVFSPPTKLLSRHSAWKILFVVAFEQSSSQPAFAI